MNGSDFLVDLKDPAKIEILLLLQKIPQSRGIKFTSLIDKAGQNASESFADAQSQSPIYNIPLRLLIRLDDHGR